MRATSLPSIHKGGQVANIWPLSSNETSLGGKKRPVSQLINLAHFYPQRGLRWAGNTQSSTLQDTFTPLLPDPGSPGSFLLPHIVKKLLLLLLSYCSAASRFRTQPPKLLELVLVALNSWKCASSSGQLLLLLFCCCCCWDLRLLPHFLALVPEHRWTPLHASCNF